MFLLPFKTPEEKKEVFRRAKKGDAQSISFLRDTYHLRVWTEQEICALNLLIVNKVFNKTTAPYFRMLRCAAEKWRVLSEEAKKVAEVA